MNSQSISTIKELGNQIDLYLEKQALKYQKNNKECGCPYGKCPTGKCNKLDLLEIWDLIKAYNGSDWKEYQVENDKKYNRIKIPVSNQFEDIYDIYILTWKMNQQSAIHDHSRNGCILKVLEGKLMEKQYTPDPNSPKLTSQQCIEAGNQGYINNSIAFHQILNSEKETAVSLHIYSPPDYHGNTF